MSVLNDRALLACYDYGDVGEFYLTGGDLPEGAVRMEEMDSLVPLFEALTPCPFCGSTDQILSKTKVGPVPWGALSYRVDCCICHARGPETKKTPCVPNTHRWKQLHFETELEAMAAALTGWGQTKG